MKSTLPPETDLIPKLLASWTPRPPSAAIRQRLFEATATAESALAAGGLQRRESDKGTRPRAAGLAAWLMPCGAAGAAAVFLVGWLAGPGLPAPAVGATTNGTLQAVPEWTGNHLAGVNNVPIQHLTSTLSNLAPSTNLPLRSWN